MKNRFTLFAVVTLTAIAVWLGLRDDSTQSSRDARSARPEPEASPVATRPGKAVHAATSVPQPRSPVAPQREATAAGAYPPASAPLLDANALALRSEALLRAHDGDPRPAPALPLYKPASMPERPASEADREELPEDEAMVANDNRPEQRAWRAAFLHEGADGAWTHQMREEIAMKEASLLKGGVSVQNLSCRETICRMYLQFRDDVDARSFIESPRDPELEYEFQSLDPNYNGEGFDESDYTYEVLVKRPRPEGTPAREPTEPSLGGTVDSEESMVGQVTGG